MDNPQHYQPLSHALHPPSSNPNRGHVNQVHYSNSEHHTSYIGPPKPTTGQSNVNQEEEEEEEEEEDNDDEGLVAEQLNQNDPDLHESAPVSPKASATGAQSSAHSQLEATSPAPETKRRPGRPRGSKNRRPRIGSAKHESQFYYQTPAPVATSTITTTPAAALPPQHSNINASNQQYYEFQWRVLNLCAEFYGAAEELVKGTAPLVIAQCYHMGPGVKIDPLAMLAEAKRVCDALLANPSQLITNPPPPMYPVMPTLYHSMTVPTAPAPAPASAPLPPMATMPPPPATSVINPPTVITNPQTFSVPLGSQPSYPQYSMYAPPPGQYPTTPYYQYTAYGQPGAYYAHPPQPIPVPTVPPNVSTSTPIVSPGQPTATITTTPATGGTVIGNQGAWSDEESERLRILAEESRVKGPSGDIEWDWVISEWGISRTRHQILIKATAMGLKESSSRGTKRRRDNEEQTSAAPVMASLQQPTATSTSSPSQSASQPASTPAASPAMQHQQRPPSSKGLGTLNQIPAPVTASKLPWPMPTVAINTSSPVIATSSSGSTQELQRSNYYRPRPNQDAAPKPSPISQQQQPAAQQWYQPNGQTSPGMRPKENGK